MFFRSVTTRLLVVFLLAFLVACQPASKSEQPGSNSVIKVLAVESFIADITQNVARERAAVQTLIPSGIDPHSFLPSPLDVARITACDVLVLNGAGLEEWIAGTLENAGGEHLVIEAAEGIPLHQHEEDHPETDRAAEDAHAHEEGDPHLWLNPIHVMRYTENIRDGLSAADPDGKEEYAANAEAYIARLKDLDIWIEQSVSVIPPSQRKIVTNHESFGYFAERYGFTIIGTVIPSTSSEASPSAQQMAALIDQIRQTGTKAIFLEFGANQKLADQIAADTGIAVVADLYNHSLTGPDGPAPTYIDMMKHNTNTIVNALGK